MSANATPQIGRPWPGDLIAVLRRVSYGRTLQKKSNAGRGSATIVGWWLVSDGYADGGRRLVESGRNAVPRPQGAPAVRRPGGNQAALRIGVGGIGTDLGLSLRDAPTAGRPNELKVGEGQHCTAADPSAHCREATRVGTPDRGRTSRGSGCSSRYARVRNARLHAPALGGRRHHPKARSRA